MPIKDLCPKGAFSGTTFCKWRTKFGGVDLPDARRLREFEQENAKLKRLPTAPHGSDRPINR